MILVAAAGSLRPTYLLCTAGIVAALPMVKWLLERPSEGRSPLRLFLPVAWVAAGSFVLLVPWASVLWQSNQTPLYPPFLGTMNPEFTVLGNKAGAFHDISHAFAYLFIPEVVVLLLCFLLAACVPNRPLVLAAAAVAVGVSIFTSYKFGVTVLFESYRYTFPMLMPVALWTVLSAISSQALLEFKTSASGMAAVIGLLLAVNLTGGSRELQAAVDGLPAQISSRQPLINPALTNAVQELQRYTSEGSAIFAAVDTPYAFNFARNRIVTADVPGGARIGTWPVGQGPEALKAYLLSQGIDYLMVPDFDNAMLLYTRKHWTEHQRPEWFFKEVWGKYSLDFMESADQLARSQGIVATAANLRLIDLN